eukprot:gene6082-8380_t
MLSAYGRGNACLMNGDFGQALNEFNRAIKISPNNPDIYLSRGIANEKLLNWNEAIEDYKYANKLIKSSYNPFAKDDATAISNIANAETGLLQWDQALKDFDYASKLQKDFLAPQIGKALVQYQLNQKEESLAFFKSLVEKYPDFADGLAAFVVISYQFNPTIPIDSNIIDDWEKVISLDSRYNDVDWVLDIRRWSPKLVEDLVKFKTVYSSNTATNSS